MTLVSLFVLAIGMASPQGITVTVDGFPVDFPDAGPRMVRGRVLVPLRGVFEKMGATVHWMADTRTVSAYKGDKDAELQIGAWTATVNGVIVTMDVPAMILSRRTMVPLRFISEALGGEVEWDSSTKTVMVTTSGGP